MLTYPTSHHEVLTCIFEVTAMVVNSGVTSQKVSTMQADHPLSEVPEFFFSDLELCLYIKRDLWDHTNPNVKFIYVSSTPDKCSLVVMLHGMFSVCTLDCYHHKVRGRIFPSVLSHRLMLKVFSLCHFRF